MSDRIYCSELARSARAPLFGTALQVDLWLLVEYSRPWRPKALEDNELPDEVSVALMKWQADVRSQQQGSVRLQFIKQAGSTDRQHPRVMVADVRTCKLVGCELTDYREIMDLRGDLAGMHAVDEAQLLVCTNGQRDLCCARFGLPLYEALRVEWNDQVWQTTHVGGHRYAPNLLSLPDGHMYGHVMAEQGPDLVREHLAGRLSLEYLRGCSRDEPEGQAVKQMLREYLEERDLDSVELQQCAVDGNGIRAELSCAGVRYSVVARRVPGEPALASCGADPKPVDNFVLESIAAA